ncbi:unnamed protein product [Vitrella brassicaformis CCMP3155]|uniref:Uncharacterized protein n=1 Tax=Vitrella brassicaformis (strain CCMP3155) TaxID=1169540 RepID=A0A0G4EA22_VITBC|nr:unnamed protein product [Vitrella brassicaformis CCMP3155]|eukprot:CEL92052.1 unnamed protein product [Vitrella brassicaformis CCMP3155]
MMRFGVVAILLVGLAALVQPLLAGQRTGDRQVSVDRYGHVGEVSAFEAQQMALVQLQLDKASTTITAAYKLNTAAHELAATADITKAAAAVASQLEEAQMAKDLSRHVQGMSLSMLRAQVQQAKQIMAAANQLSKTSNDMVRTALKTISMAEQQLQILSAKSWERDRPENEAAPRGPCTVEGTKNTHDPDKICKLHQRIDYDPHKPSIKKKYLGRCTTKEEAENECPETPPSEVDDGLVVDGKFVKPERGAQLFCNYKYKEKY